jgi:hypothetical protein
MRGLTAIKSFFTLKEEYTMKKIMFGVIAPIASMFSMLVTPLEVSANCCAPQTCCDPCDECCDNGWMQYVGLALVAAGAGALAGWGAAEATNSKGSRGRHGATGPTGPTGPTGGSFVVNPADTLTATAPLAAIVITGGTGSVIPFVSTPDGLVLTGPAIPLSTIVTALTITWPTVPAGDVVSGTYEYGLTIVNSGALVTVGTTILPTVLSTETGVATALPALVIPALTLLSPAGESQIQSDFTYDFSVFP